MTQLPMTMRIHNARNSVLDYYKMGHDKENEYIGTFY